MDANVKAAAQECTVGSDSGRLIFPQVVMKLVEAGVERYHADLRRSEKTFYTPNGESLVVACAPVGEDPATDFSPAGVETAIRAVQAGKLNYKAFCREIGAAGCVGYIVSLAGRRAVYYGRTGETHVEPFPPAK